MALIWPFGVKLTDSSGNALSGAKLRVYTANTTTLVNLYSDAALTVPITNPVVATSSGLLASGGNECAVYVAAGTYDIAILSSADAVLDNVDDYIPWGSESGDIDRTVTGNGRFKVTGSAGAVLIQAGDPSPDNVGGTLTIEGQAGTQLDTLTLDAAVVNSTGYTKEGGKKLPGTVYTEATTFSAVTSVDIALPNSPTGARAWRITVFDFTVTASSSIQFKASFDDGATVKSGASDYDVASLEQEASSAVAEGDEATTTTVLGDGSITTPTNRPGKIVFEVVTPNSGSDSTLITGQYFLHDSQATPVPCIGVFATWVRGGYGRMTHLRLLQTTGGQTMTGKYVTERLYGYGEA